MKLRVIYETTTGYPGDRNRERVTATTVLTGDTIEQLFERLYQRHCSESYCYPRSNMRPVCAKKEQQYKQWERTWASNINNYAKYNKMD